MSLKKTIKSGLGPLVRAGRRTLYRRKFERSAKLLSQRLGDRMKIATRIEYGDQHDHLWKKLQEKAPPHIRFQMMPLDKDPLTNRLKKCWAQYGEFYGNGGQEKCLEHSLTFELLNFEKVRRYCDVAASFSRIERVLAAEWEGVEYWKQDLEYTSDFLQRRIGGFAQHMQDVPGGFFDALTLHCSFEHFSGTADTEFVAEVDRVLSPNGACLILPLYIGAKPCVYFDPTSVSEEQLRTYDSEAELRALWDYRQEHGRYYSPETLISRVLGRLPSTLIATMVRFTGQESIGPGIYLHFGLVLHRSTSVFRYSS